MNIFELPPEVFVFEIAVFMDLVSLKAFSEVCVFARNMFIEMKKEIERNLKENIEQRRKRYLNKLKKWTEKRNEMTETQKKDVNGEFVDCMIEFGYIWGEELYFELKQIYERGGGGFVVSIHKLTGPYSCYCDIGHIAYEMMEFTSTIQNAREGLKVIKIQADAQVKSKRYCGNGYTLEDFFGYQIGSGIYKKNATEEYLELNLEVIRVCRAAGGNFNVLKEFVAFLSNASNSFKKVKSSETRRLKKLIIKFVRFMIEEIGSNPLEIYQEHHEYGVRNQSAFLEVFAEEEIHFVVPYLINPYELIEFYPDRFWKYIIPNFSLSSKIYSSKFSRKLLKKLLRVKNLCRSICDQNPYFLFDLIERKERKLVNLTIRELGVEYCVNTLRDSNNNSLLHILCGVRGKTEKMVKFLLNLGFDVNEKNIKGETPIMKSLEIHHFKVTKILKEHVKKE